MAIEMLSYSQLGERLKCSSEAARALVKRLRLPRQKANDGKVLVSVDLTEINHKPMPARSPAGHHSVAASLKVRVEELQAALAERRAAERPPVRAGATAVIAHGSCVALPPSQSSRTWGPA